MTKLNSLNLLLCMYLSIKFWYWLQNSTQTIRSIYIETLRPRPAELGLPSAGREKITSHLTAKCISIDYRVRPLGDLKEARKAQKILSCRKSCSLLKHKSWTLLYLFLLVSTPFCTFSPYVL